jgi:FkbM family methyltransferase
VHYNSQFGQDRFLDEHVFKRAEGLTFVEIGSAEPIELNNSYFFEKYRQWRGLLVEARPSACEKLRSERLSEVANVCISSNQGRSIFLDYGYLAGLCKYMDKREHEYIEQYNSRDNEVRAYWVNTEPLCTILGSRKIERIHLLGIDVEGAEVPVLQTLDFKAIFIDVIMAESNSPAASIKLDDFLNPNGFFLKEVVGADRIYLHQDSDYNWSV